MQKKSTADTDTPLWEETAPPAEARPGQKSLASLWMWREFCILTTDVFIDVR